MGFAEKYTKEQKEYALRLVRDGKTHKEAAEESGVALNYLRTIIYSKREKVRKEHARRQSKKESAPSQASVKSKSPVTGDMGDLSRKVVHGSALTVSGNAIEKYLEENKDEVERLIQDAVKDKTIEMQEKLSEMILLATQTAIDVIKTGPKPKESKSYWLKAVIGAIAQGVEKHQLIGGKPTGRFEQQGEVTQRHEYDILHKVEEYTDVYQKLAERGEIQSLDESDDTGESVDSDNTDS